MDLWDIPAIDQHAHNLLNHDEWASYPYAAIFTESRDPLILQHHAPHTLFFHRSLRDMATLLSCDPTQKAVDACRRSLGLDALTTRCLQASNLAAVFLDDGFAPDRIMPWQAHRRWVPVRRILRLEHMAETSMAAEATFNGFIDRFRSQLDPPSAEVVALKSIAAYRSGLDITSVSQRQVRDCFYALKKNSGEKGIRLSAKPLIDYLVLESLPFAAKHHLPVQFHTGFGDADLNLERANPLHLRNLLEAPAWREVPIVMLHAGYPFVREAGYLAAVYPQVHVDFGLTIPFTSVAGMRAVLGQLLELAPTTKLLFSSDAHLTPELFYLGAKWGREALAHVLASAVQDGDLTSSEADRAAEGILYDNARALYAKTSSIEW